MQRALLQSGKPENAPLVRAALRRVGRTELIGFDKGCLVRPERTDGGQSTPKGGAALAERISVFLLLPVKRGENRPLSAPENRKFYTDLIANSQKSKMDKNSNLEFCCILSKRRLCVLHKKAADEVMNLPACGTCG